jgi:hypothetical protein
MRFLLKLLFCSIVITNLTAVNSIEDFLNMDESDSEENEFSEILSRLSQKPLNLKIATDSDLENLFWLTDEQLKMLKKHIKSKTISYRILAENNYTDDEIRFLRNYTTIQEPLNYNFSQRIRSSYQEKYKQEPSSTAFYQRMLADFQNYHFCFLTQKDATEKEISNFYSYFLAYQSDTILRKVIIGRYRLAFGQGLLMDSKLGVSKGSATTTIPAKHQFSVRGYTSSYEIWFLEGGAAEISFSDFSVVPFYSNSKYAASLREGKISSFNESGIYKPTQTYIHETLYGTYTRWKNSKVAIGFQFLINEFSHPFFDVKKSQSYNALATDWHYANSFFIFAGEVARADEKTAFLSYLKWGDKAIKHLILVRSYPDYFPTWHGKPFSSQSTFDNEQGVYYGLETRFKKFKLNAFFDVWRFPATRYYEKMPTAASEELIQIETKTKKQKWTFSANHKTKEKYKTLDDESKIRNYQRTVLRCDWWNYYDFISFKTRFEYASEYYKNEQLFQKGILVSQLVRLQFSAFHVIAQIAMYHSDILHYMYEYSMDGQMENAVLSGDGIYSYILLKFLVIKNAKVQFKISDRWNKANYLKLGLQIEYSL